MNMTTLLARPEEITSAEQVSRLRLVILRLARRVRQEGHPGITPSQLAVMASLNRYGPMTVGEIATAERVQPPSISRIVRALEEGGHVRRATLEDRRSARVSLTPQARRLIQGIRTQRDAWLRQRLARLSPRELQ